MALKRGTVTQKPVSTASAGKTIFSSVIARDSGEMDEDPSMPGSASGSMEALVENMVQSTYKRQAAKRRAINHDREALTKNVHEALDRLHKTHQSKVAILRRSKLERLGKLLQEQVKLEGKILQGVRTLEVAYRAANQELCVGLKGKMQESERRGSSGGS